MPCIPCATCTHPTLRRRDVFKERGLSPPNTWEEMVELAKQLNGTDFSGDGEGDFALCFGGWAPGYGRIPLSHKTAPVPCQTLRDVPAVRQQ